METDQLRQQADGVRVVLGGGTDAQLLQLLDVLQHFGVGVDDLLKAGDHPAAQGREGAAHAGVALLKQRAAQLLLRVVDVAYQDGAGTVELLGRLVEVAVVVRRQHSLHLFS